MKYTNYQRRLLDDAFAMLANVTVCAVPEVKNSITDTLPTKPVAAKVEETESLSLIERAALKISKRKADRENVTPEPSPEESIPTVSPPFKHSRFANQQLLDKSRMNETAEEFALDDA